MNSRDNQPVVQSRQQPVGNQSAPASPQSTNLADLLERVLDKGIVIAGDITLSLGTIELLTLKIRLLIASVDKAQEIGIDWWKSDPALSSQARRQQLEDRIARLEDALGGDHQAGGDDRRDLLEQRLERLEASIRSQSQGDQPHEDQPSSDGS